MKSAPPGWRPDQIVTRIDGWVIDPNNKDRVPTAVAAMIARAMPRLGGSTVAASERACWRAKRKSLAMSREIPAEEGSAEDVTSLAEPEAAAQVDGGDNGSGLNDDVDEYDDRLTALGRTEEDDEHIAVHEAGHAIAARLLGHALGGATVDPGPGYAGRVWGDGHLQAFAEGRGDASDVREVLAPLIPSAGEDHSSVSDVFGNVYTQVIELMAGRAAERMLLDGEPALPVDDLRQARELVMLFCKSEAAVHTFIAHCDVAARDLLMPYGDVVMVLSTVLRIKRTLDGDEIDKTISDVEAGKAIAIERRRRADWRTRETSARAFRQNVTTAGSASLPHYAQDQRI